MPVMWYVKDGPRPQSTRGSGTPLSFADISGAFGTYRSEFLSLEPPQFNVNAPSRYPSRVVIEVRNEDGTNAQFPQPGFYVILDLSPSQAHRLLSRHGTTAS
jgi:hypothetical protein